MCFGDWAAVRAAWQREMEVLFNMRRAGMCAEDDFRVKMAALHVMNNKADKTHEFGSKKQETMSENHEMTVYKASRHKKIQIARIRSRETGAVAVSGIWGGEGAGCFWLNVRVFGGSFEHGGYFAANTLF